ncbi:hypothetical protein ACVNIS_07895 [Sphaerotilaceae bacterium SBD11-9]
MTKNEATKGPRRRIAPKLNRWAGACAAVLGLATGCGGGGPLGNPPDITNEATEGGQKLSFAYFQRCINPIFLELLPIVGTQTTNTCAGSGCHDNANGTGGAFRVIPSAASQPVPSTPAAADTVRGTDMYKNFYSAQGEVVMNNVSQSRLLTKPRVQGVLHGGGLIFESDSDPHVVLMRYWMSHPAPAGQDEFSTDPGNGSCSTQ